MSKSSQDIIGVLRGLQLVAKAGVNVHDKYLRHIWRTSSFRDLTATVSEDVAQKTATAAGKPTDILATITDTIERTGTVMESIKGYTQYATGISSVQIPSAAPLVDTEEEVDPKKYEIKLSPSDKEILERLDIEYAKKILDEHEKRQKENSNAKKKEKDKPFNVKKPRKQKKTEFPDGMEPHSSSKVDLTNSNPAERSIPKPKARPSLSSTSKQRTVPSSRIARMVSFGSLAAGLGLGTAAEMARRTILGKETVDPLDSVFLSSANMDRIVDTLCKVRGAALKIGQLLSIQDEAVVSQQLAKALERVRQSADFMPFKQVEQVMVDQFGDDWRDNVAEFEMKPFAAASIGQVHWAKMHDGMEVAVKIQYPGVAKGIDSDIDNLIGIMKVWNVFPEGMFIDNLVTVAKRELAWEVDYEREAECTRTFRNLLQPYPEYYVPKVIDSLTSMQVFTTELVEGIPVDKCINENLETRQFIAEKTIKLLLHEVLEFQYMQTDPNWANFLYNKKNHQIVLLDFGASRAYSKQFMDQYVRIIKAAADNDRQTVLEISRKMGFLTGYESLIMEAAHVDACMVFGEMFRTEEEFDFGAQDTTRKIISLVPTMLKHRLCPPPEEIYSLHRKLSGIFLLCSKLKVSLSCRQMFLDMYKKYTFDDGIVN